MPKPTSLLTRMIVPEYEGSSLTSDAHSSLSQTRLSDECASLVSELPSYPGTIILVSNEVGLGIVPDHPLGRRFRDAAGRLNQDLGRVCDRVTLAVAGLPMALKG